METTDPATDRFKVLVGPEDYADHLLDLGDVALDEALDELVDVLFDTTEFSEKAAQLDELMDMLLTHSWGMPGELMCGHGSKTFGTDLVSLPEYAARRGLDALDFDGERPDGLCAHCWSNTRETLAEEAERNAAGVPDRIGDVGYRLRWKQKGRAREEWYDIVVRPETTMAELDRLVCRFSTLDDFHLRMYGLEDEYLDSSIQVVPDHQHSMNPSDTRASEVTVGEIAQRADLWEGDRLSLVYDFGTPSYFYCIVKEVYEPSDLDSLLAGADHRAATETAAIVDQKRP